MKMITLLKWQKVIKIEKDNLVKKQIQIKKVTCINIK